MQGIYTVTTHDQECMYKAKITAIDGWWSKFRMYNVDDIIPIVERSAIKNIRTGGTVPRKEIQDIPIYIISRVLIRRANWKKLNCFEKMYIYISIIKVSDILVANKLAYVPDEINMSRVSGHPLYRTY